MYNKCKTTPYKDYSLKAQSMPIASLLLSTSSVYLYAAPYNI